MLAPVYNPNHYLGRAASWHHSQSQWYSCLSTTDTVTARLTSYTALPQEDRRMINSMILQCMPGVTDRRARERERESCSKSWTQAWGLNASLAFTFLYTEESMTRNTSDALPFVRERLGAGQRLTAPDKLGWNRKPKLYSWDIISKRICWVNTR